MEQANLLNFNSNSGGQFKALVESTPDTIIIADAQNKIVFCNDKIKETFGYEVAEVINQDLGMLMPAQYREGHRRGLERFLQSHQPRIIGKTIEIEGLCQDGTVFPIELSLSYWEEGIDIYFASIIRDISVRNRIIQEYKLLQNLSDAINAATDFNSALGISLTKVCERTGWDYGEAWLPDQEGQFLKRSNNWYTKDPTLNTFAAISKHLKIKPGESLSGRVFQSSSSEWITDMAQVDTNTFNRAKLALERGLISGLGVPIASEGKVLAVLIFFKKTARKEDTQLTKLIESVAKQLGNVLQRKRTEQQLIETNNLLEQRVTKRTKELQVINDQLNQKNIELQKINTDLDNFVYIASHDLKAPLLNIGALLNILQEELPADFKVQEQEILSRLDRTILEMKQTMQSISEVAKVQRQEIIYQEPVPLKELYTDILASIDELLISNQVSIEADFSEVPVIEFSYINLKSILNNLITNAIKYRSPERLPQIYIKTSRVAGYILLTITDNGLGIDLEKNQHKLFKMFVRLHSHVEGSGIGLYIVKRIVENNQGKLEVESQVGVGTTFKVYIKE